VGLMLKGISVAKGVAIGKAVLLKRDDFDIKELIVPKPLLSEEVARYKLALKKTRQQLKVVRKRIASNAPADITAFVDAHLLMLKDSTINEGPVHFIKTRQCNAEWALKLQKGLLVDAFEAMDDPYLSARKYDVHQIISRIQRNLYEQPGMSQDIHQRWLNGGIVVSDDVSPDDIIMMHQQGVAGLITEFGGANSHTAILARSLGMPAVVGIHHARRSLLQNELLVIDGRHGVVYSGLDASSITHFRQRQRAEQHYLNELQNLREEPSTSVDGQRIDLLGNIELFEDVPAVKHVNAVGIGLFRTEMLFLNRDCMPDEDEQFKLYKKVVRSMAGKPVTIRSIDFGADKNLLGSSAAMHSNPALGLRAIRLCLKDYALFVPQIRAILRASAFGPVRMMIPLLTTVCELTQVIRLVDDAKQSLLDEGIKYGDDFQLGGMIEVPSAALMADEFATQLDFMSIGTNDLIQYTLAVDRMDDEVNYLYDPLHPAVLKLISMVINAGKKANIPVSMCGEMAGDPRYTQLLLGLGLREFSMYAATLLEVKRIVLASDVQQLTEWVKKIHSMSTAEEISEYIDDFPEAAEESASPQHSSL